MPQLVEEVEEVSEEVIREEEDPLGVTTVMKQAIWIEIVHYPESLGVLIVKSMPMQPKIALI